MKFPHSTPRSVSICVSLLIAYAQIISSLVVFSAQSAYASSTSQVATRQNASEPLAQGSSGVTFVQDSQKPMYREDEVLVRFRATATEPEKNTVALTHTAGRMKLKGDSGIEKLKISRSQSPETVALSLLQQPSVELAEPNFLIRPDQAEVTLPNDDQFGNQRALRNTGQEGMLDLVNLAERCVVMELEIGSIMQTGLQPELRLHRPSHNRIGIRSICL